MAENDAGEKTELPTQKRLEDAREEGQIAKSPELTTAAFLLGSTLTLAVAGPPLWRFLIDTMGSTLATAGDAAIDGSGSISLLQVTGFRSIVAISGIAVAMAAIAVSVQLAQTGGILTAKPLRPKFSRMNPLTNAKNIFGMQSIAELVKSLLKLTIMSWAVYATLRNAWPDIQMLTLGDTHSILDVVRKYSVTLLRNAGLMLLAVAGADYAWQRWRRMEQLKMTKQQVKDEYKQQEGDQAIKGRRRSIARERLRRQMFAAVKTADVVIVNPVHIAVAIRYNPQIAPAPYVVAIGQRKIAQRIKELAFKAGVPVVENRPLARALFASAKLGSMIPVEMYLAVAEVLAFVMKQRERYGSSWRGTAAA